MRETKKKESHFEAKPFTRLQQLKIPRDECTHIPKRFDIVFFFKTNNKRNNALLIHSILSGRYLCTVERQTITEHERMVQEIWNETIYVINL